MSRPPSKQTGAPRSPRSHTSDVQGILARLERRGSQAAREGMARYAITSPKLYGVSVTELRQYAKELGTNHTLAQALWDAGAHEARMLGSLIEDPAQVTSAQMDRWAKDFDNWAICDTVCIHLFRRTPLAWRKVTSWSRRRGEFVKRAAFALLASLAVHEKREGDERFRQGLRLVEQAAQDERGFVKKSVNWALRAIGKRNPALHLEALTLARRLAAAEEPSPRWVGKDALRELSTPAVRHRVKGKSE